MTTRADEERAGEVLWLMRCDEAEELAETTYQDYIKAHPEDPQRYPNGRDRGRLAVMVFALREADLI